MRPKAWDETGCERPALGLGDAEPVRGICPRYARPQPVVFDMHCELELGAVCCKRMRREFRGWSASLGPGDVWLTGPCGVHGDGTWVRFVPEGAGAPAPVSRPAGASEFVLRTREAGARIDRLFLTPRAEEMPR
jgi:hypothetical protein